MIKVIHKTERDPNNHLFTYTLKKGDKYAEVKSRSRLSMNKYGEPYLNFLFKDKINWQSLH